MEYTTNHILSRIIDDKAFLLNPYTGMYYTLNPVATYVWEKLQANLAEADIIQEMAQEFSIDAPLIKADCQELIQNFIQQSILLPVNT